MGRNRKTITDYLIETDEPIDELWHQALLDEMEQCLAELAEEMGIDDEQQ